MRRTIVLAMIGTIVLAVTVIVSPYTGWALVTNYVLPIVGGGAIGVLIGKVLLRRENRHRLEDARVLADWHTAEYRKEES